MPIVKCQKDGKPGFKCGSGGTCYTYTAGNEASKQAAKSKAKKQCQAIHDSKERK